MDEEYHHQHRHRIKLERSQSCLIWIAGRSRSSGLLLQENSSSDRLLPLPGYERLSRSLRIVSEEGKPQQKTWRGSWFRKVMRRVFFFQKNGGEGACSTAEDKAVEGRRKRSPSGPHLGKRWPVQGW